MSDWLDDALRELAEVEAPEGLARRVRVRLDDRGVGAARWPRLAAAATLAVVVVTGTWIAVTVDREGEVRVDRALGGGAEAPPARKGAPPSERTQVTPPAASLRAGGASVRAGRALASPSRMQPSTPQPVPLPDHEHALPALSDIQPIVQAAVGPDALAIETAPIAPLHPLVPITVPALGDEGERR